MSDNWESFDEVLLNESNKGSITARAEDEIKKHNTELITAADLTPDETMKQALTKAQELIAINQATDTHTLISKMRDQFIVNRVSTATATENAVNKTLAKLVAKLETEDMPVNTLLKVLTMLRDSSIQDMSSLLGAPNPNDPRSGNNGTVVNIMNAGVGQSQVAQPQQPVQQTSNTDNSSADVSKFLEITKLAVENIRDGKVSVSDQVKESVVDASYEEVKPNES